MTHEHDIYTGVMLGKPFVAENGKVTFLKVEIPQSPTPTKPIIPDRKPECQKKHIKRDGRK